MKKLSAIWFLLKNKQGHFLVELQFAAAIIALCAAVFYNDFALAVQSWQKSAVQMQLQSAAGYMFSELEKDLAYESEYIVVDKDYKGRTALKCRTVYRGKLYLYTYEKNGLYKTTQTTATQGKNPLYIPDCRVRSWQAEKLTDKTILLKITLEKNGQQKTFLRNIYCINGRITDETA